MPPVVLARIKAKPGCERQLTRAISTMIAQADKDETGSAPRHALYRCAEEPGLLILWERRDGDSASEPNGGGELIEELAGLIDGRPILETLVEAAED